MNEVKFIQHSVSQRKTVSKLYIITHHWCFNGADCPAILCVVVFS